MLQRLLVLGIVFGAAYWYWQGPYQQKVNPDYATVLDQNDEKMAACVRAKLYRTGVTGEGPNASAAEEGCASELNLYQSEGCWHNYKTSRQN